MWSIHDDIRTNIKQISQLLEKDTLDIIQLNKLFGMLFFDVRGMIFREEFVLIPVLERMFTKEIWDTLRTYKHEGYEKQITWSTSESGIQLPTGLLQTEQLIQIFNHLPVDITLIDSQDRVVFFNTPENRIFPRNHGVIGRDVKNCHPPKSIAIVERILDAFKRGERTTAEFRILMHEKYLLIRYIALYTEKGEYDGVLEVLQDITEITKMKGEQRLLDWE
jgi:PAS domain S-box-containing protein